MLGTEVVLHDLKLLLQRHFSDGLVTIVGSGLSCAEGLPGMGELADHLCQAIGTSLKDDEIARWREILPLLKEIGLEAALLSKPPGPALEAEIVTETAKIIAKREKEVITEVFLGVRTLRLTGLLRHIIKPAHGIPIITTNYDRLVEIAVEEAGLGVDTMFVGRLAGKLNEKESRLSFCRDVSLKKNRISYHYQTRVIVYKPHGSLDWYARNGQPVHYSGDLVGIARLIITPGKNKFRNGYDSPFDHHRSRANDAIDRGSRFLILGYGFNDDHLETHLLPAIRGGKPALLITYKLSSTAEALANECGNVIALEKASENGVDGTRAIVNRVESFIPNKNLWDVQSFIKEVLEP